MPTNVIKLHLKYKNTRICSCLVIVNQGGQNNRNGKSSNTNYQKIELIVEQGRVITTSNLIKH